MRIMRLYIKRVILVLTGGLAMTILVAVLPYREQSTSGVDSPHLDSPHFSDLDDEFRTVPSQKLPVVLPPVSNRKPLNELLKLSAGPLPPVQQAFHVRSATDFVQSLPSKQLKRNFDLKLLQIESYVAQLPLKDSIECTHNETLEQYWSRRFGRPWQKTDSWERFYAQIGSCDLYRKDSPEVTQLLHDMATMPIKHVSMMEGGTQVKLVITYENGKQAVLKPMRYGRDYETDPNHFYFSDFERHHAEIAAFHLDKVLGFRRAVPTVGRIVNISSELHANAEKALAKTFFVSPAKNLCFVSKCDYYCDTSHAICGKPDMKEGSFQVFLMDEEEVPRDHNRSPYKRTYSKRNQLAPWQMNSTFCDSQVKRKPTFNEGRRLLDVVDMSIFDFLMGNQDRHHFETFAVFDDYPAYPIHLDNGRGFGKSKEDDMDILAPLAQCCLIRPSTIRTLLAYYAQPQSLTEALDASLAKDPVAPLLDRKHYVAMERRLGLVVDVVRRCFDRVKDLEKMIMTNFKSHLPPLDDEKEEKEE